MKKKSRNLFKYILVSVFTVIFIFNTLVFSAMIFEFDIPYFGRVNISRDDYDEYRKLKKVSELKKDIEELYYKETESDSLVEGAIRGMFDSLDDKYSYYISEDELKRKKNNEQGILIGIGVSIEILADGKIKIISVDESGTAKDSGIVAGDIILEIDDIVLTPESVSEAIGIIGRDNREFIIFGDYPSVNLLIMRGDETISMDVERKRMSDRALSYEIIDNIGYIKIDRFIKNTPDYFKEALVYFNENKTEKIILDLRDNPGGLLESLVESSGYLTGKQTILSVRERSGKETEYVSENDRIFKGDICILINENSASAAEAMTLALREHIGAKVVGVKSFGKGIVQTTYNLPDGTGYKLTTSEYFSPKGKSIHLKGVIPDYQIEEYELQIKKAIELLKGEN
jgi:carboxyl-terminal processing protease